jgi:hypothetical protein
VVYIIMHWTCNVNGFCGLTLPASDSFAGLAFSLLSTTEKRCVTRKESDRPKDHEKKMDYIVILHHGTSWYYSQLVCVVQSRRAAMWDSQLMPTV